MMRRPATALVIFDFDGVIADSEIIALAELQQCLGEHGLRMPHDALIDRFLGVSTMDIVAYVDERAGTGAGARMKDAWYRRLLDRYAAELEIMPHALELLAWLDDAGIRYCIATGGTWKRLGISMERLGLAELFADAAFTAEAVRSGKPEPDLFLFAASAMQAPPDACLVVEDAPSGVAAARRAGMKALGYVGGRHLATRRPQHAERLLAEGAVAVIDDLADVSGHV
jgi:HAD superfamily hydrolase (TIGR01509 family)